MLEAVTIDVAIDRDWRDLYEAFWRPEAFATWASGLMSGHLRQDRGRWLADGPEGPVHLRFSEHNPYGIMDHWVEVGDATIYVPIRVVGNGTGALVSLTLFRQPAMTDDHFHRDREWVRRDLAALKTLAERR